MRKLQILFPFRSRDLELSHRHGYEDQDAVGISKNTLLTVFAFKTFES